MFRTRLFSSLSGLVALPALGALPQAGQAARITYTLTGQSSGDFNETSFTNQAVTVTGVGHTANATAIAAPRSVPAGALSAKSLTIN